MNMAFRCAALLVLTFSFEARSQVSASSANDHHMRILDRGETRWFTNQYSRKPLLIALVNARTVAACEALTVRFINLSPGTTSVPPQTLVVNAEWEAAAADGEQCRVRYRWRFGDIPGRQDLLMRVERAVPDVAASSISGALRIHGTAHVPATLFVGLAYPDRLATGDDRKSRAIVGADFPLVWRGFAALYPTLDHFRFTVATSFGKPGDDIYWGLQVLPLIEGPRVVGFPLAVSVGHRWARGGNGIYVAGTYNASGLVKEALGGLGIK